MACIQHELPLKFIVKCWGVIVNNEILGIKMGITSES